MAHIKTLAIFLSIPLAAAVLLSCFVVVLDSFL